MVRAKFKVISNDLLGDNNHIMLHPVIDGSAENKLYVDFTKAEKEELKNED